MVREPACVNMIKISALIVAVSASLAQRAESLEPPPPPPSPMPHAGTAIDRDSSNGVPKVEIQVDGGVFTRIVIPPPSPPIPGAPIGAVSWNHNLDTRTLADGSHTVNVQATSFVTGQMQSASIQLIVANSTPPPPTGTPRAR